MGLDINAVQFLIAARQRGVNFGEVLTLGRQDLNVYPKRMAQLLAKHGFPAGKFEQPGDQTLYSEPVFESLGATRVRALDASGFEGASVVHDLNQPLPAELREQFDVVYDGGTLEHVFNFPTALKSCMEMVRPGGHLFIHTVTNNYCGHGFYQFSPELFFRALGRENGFQLERMVIHCMGPYGNWREVSDPEQIRARVELMTLMPMQLLIQARRVAVVPVFAQAPQQSDYSPRWDQSDPAAAKTAEIYKPPRPALSRSLPGLTRLLNVFRTAWHLLRTHSILNGRSFKRVKRP